MSQAEFEITIAPNGEVKVNVVGAQGTTCTDLSKFLEEALGDVTDRKFKSEYYQSANTRSHSQQNQQY